jgi:uncharacterized protein (TIGR02246 family)
LALLLVVLLLAVPASGRAQGGVPGGRSDDGRLQYNMMVNDGVAGLVQQWETACNKRDPAAVAALYLRNAMIVGSTGSIVNGTEGLRAYFAKNLPRLSGFRLGFYEIVASGDLAYLTGYLTYDVLYPTGGTYPASVPYSLALVQQRNGTWLIRAQTGGDFPASLAIQDDLRPGLGPGESDSVRVQVTDATGKPIRHTQVAFEVVYGGGEASPVTALTDDSGYAGAEITTAPDPGINVVLARAAPLLNEPLPFRAITEGESVAALPMPSKPPVTGIAAPTGAGTAAMAVTPAPPAASPQRPKPAAVAASPVKLARGVVVLDTAAVLAPLADPGPGAPPIGPVAFTSRDSEVARVTQEGRITGARRGETFVVVTNRVANDSLLAVVTNPGAAFLGPDLQDYRLPSDSLIAMRLILDLRSDQRLGTLSFQVQFDTSVVRFQRFEADGRIPLAVVSSRAGQGSIGVALSEPRKVTGRVELMTLVFRTAARPGRIGWIRVVPEAAADLASSADLRDWINAPRYPLVTRANRSDPPSP